PYCAKDSRPPTYGCTQSTLQVALLHAGVHACASTTQRQAFKLTAASEHSAALGITRMCAKGLKQLRKCSFERRCLTFVVRSDVAISNLATIFGRLHLAMERYVSSNQLETPRLVVFFKRTTGFC